MKIKKTIAIALMLVMCLGLFTMTGCSVDSKKSNTKNNSAIIEIDESETKEPEEVGPLANINKIAEKAESTKALYIIDKLKIGEKGDVKPGIYDLEILGGSGNIMGDRADYLACMSINWVGAVKKPENNDSPSVIRILLFEGDTLELSNISKAKFTAINKPNEMSNKIGQGQYVVGRDIKAGTYKLSTNAKMDKEFENLGWEIGIYNFDKDEERDQTLNPENNDVVVKLEDGEVITTSFYNTDHNGSADKAKLIFTPLKQ